MKLEDTTIDIFNCFAVPNNMSKISIYLSTGAHWNTLDMVVIYLGFELQQTTRSHTNNTEQFVTKIHEIVG